MIPKLQLLIATTNEGKIREIKELFEHQPIECVFLNDLPNPPAPPEETGTTFLENATLKAQYYGDATGLLTLADDAGLCIFSLKNWPGVMSARIAPTRAERNDMVLEKLQGKTGEDRGAAFRVAMTLYDPKQHLFFTAEGEDVGSITTEVRGDGGFGYDPLFYSPTFGKTYGEMSLAEKNTISHRARALNTIHYLIKNNFGAKHVVVPIAFIIRDGKLLMNLRNDPLNPEFHNTWEFPGGHVEWGETVEEAMIREVQEETGYAVKIVRQLPRVFINAVEQTGTNVRYQVYLVPYVCQIESGDGIVANDTEVMTSQWFTLDEVPSFHLLADNKEIFSALLLDLKSTIEEYHL